MCDGLPQAIVAAMTAGLLEAHGADGKVEFVMRHEDIRGQDLVEIAQLPDRQAAAIHISRRLQQHYLMAFDSDLCGLARIFSVVAKLAAMSARKQVHKPETRIVTGHLMFRSWIAQADDNSQR